MVTKLRYILFTLLAVTMTQAAAEGIKLYGVVKSKENNTVAYAAIGIEGEIRGTHSNDNGEYEIDLPKGKHTIIVSALGYKPLRKEITIEEKKHEEYNIELEFSEIMLDDVIITESASGVSRLRNSAYNVVALDTKDYLNTTKNLSDILAKSPGVKLRESGGVGSDMNIMLDGFSGKHIKIFVDGVPQEGVGSSFGLNNIPVNFAERIEIYRGVVPVEFGSDAMGGVINIVTEKGRDGWNVDASYSYGSFNTHKSFVNFNRKHKSGLTYELNFFQNYSDNNYKIKAPIEDFATGSIEKKKLHSVKRFNDTYHNEALSFKIGVTEKSWADRLMFGAIYSQMYKEIQTGVRQEIVYGDKHRKGFSIMPSLEYSKRNILLSGLDLSLTANYNRNTTTNIDTASYKFNWLGEKKMLNSAGEQSLQHTRSHNDNWNATATINYRPNRSHTHLFTLSYLFNAFNRSNTSLLLPTAVKDPISKVTNKNVAGLSYRLMPTEKWNITAFGKFYNIYAKGPVATTSNADEYTAHSYSRNAWGYGAAGTYFIIKGLQAKLSYEKAYRLPTIEEMLGDEDLEIGDIGLKPESSHNVNLNISYSNKFGRHNIYAEGGVVYRDTRDYIQRNITDLSGGKIAATYINYGKVLTKGYNLTMRYSWDKWLSAGGNFTNMRVIDNMKTAVGSSVPNLGYKEAMPNIPMLFADFDVTLHWHDFLGKGNVLTLTYDGQYVEEFCYYSSKIGANKGDYIVPDQFSHNITLSCSLSNGKYNISAEFKNITNERLYDNFSLEKAGAAFYTKLRVRLGK